MADGPNMLSRVNLQPRLVHLIAGLRLHQVEEAMALLLDYIDAGTTGARTVGVEREHFGNPREGIGIDATTMPVAPEGFILLPVDPPQHLLDQAARAYAAASRTLARAGADRAAYRALLAAARKLTP